MERMRLSIYQFSVWFSLLQSDLGFMNQTHVDTYLFFKMSGLGEGP